MALASHASTVEAQQGAIHAQLAEYTARLRATEAQNDALQREIAHMRAFIAVRAGRMQGLLGFKMLSIYKQGPRQSPGSASIVTSVPVGCLAVFVVHCMRSQLLWWASSATIAIVSKAVVKGLIQLCLLTCAEQGAQVRGGRQRQAGAGRARRLAGAPGQPHQRPGRRQQQPLRLQRPHHPRSVVFSLNVRVDALFALPNPACSPFVLPAAWQHC